MGTFCPSGPNEREIYKRKGILVLHDTQNNAVQIIQWKHMSKLLATENSIELFFCHISIKNEKNGLLGLQNSMILMKITRPSPFDWLNFYLF